MELNKDIHVNLKTGVRFDYWNEFYGREFIITSGDENKLIQSLKDKPIKKYCDYFYDVSCTDLITEKNKTSIDEMDKIVDILNTFEKSDLTIQDFGGYLQRAKKIIYG